MFEQFSYPHEELESFEGQKKLFGNMILPSFQRWKPGHGKMWSMELFIFNRVDLGKYVVTTTGWKLNGKPDIDEFCDKLFLETDERVLRISQKYILKKAN